MQEVSQQPPPQRIGGFLPPHAIEGMVMQMQQRMEESFNDEFAKIQIANKEMVDEA